MKKSLLLLSLCLTLFACGPTEVEVAVSSVSLDRSSVELKVGETVRLSATVLPADAKDKTVTWTSSSQSIATVSPSGEVKAVAAGSANITASAGGKSASCSVTVVNAAVEVSSVTLDKNRLDLTVGGTAKLTATVSPADATDKSVSWESSDTGVATVDSDGNVKALKGGTSTITAKAGGKSATALVDVMDVTPTSFEVEAAGGDISVTVVTTRKYNVESKPDWVTEVSVANQVHTFRVAANEAITERSGAIVISDDAGTKFSCEVKQAGAAPFFSISPEKVDMKAEGGTFTVTVTANHPYHLSSTPDWVTEKSLKDDVFTFEVAENKDVTERSGVIVFCDDEGVCLPCNVKQAGATPFFSISPEKVDMKAEGGTFTVTVTANHSYHLSSTPDWVTQKSLKDNVYTFEVAENKDLTERSGVVVICDDAGVCLPCSVKQAGAAPFFSISPEKVDMEAEGGTFTVTVTANHSYHLSSTPDWVTEKSFKDDVFTFEVGFNASSSERSGVVVICDDEGVCLSCVVRQEGVKPFDINPKSVNVSYQGGTFEITVTSSYGYHLSGKPDWVTEKSVNGKVHTFEAGPSSLPDARTGAITFCDDVGTCLSVTVRQESDPESIDWNRDFFRNHLMMNFICAGSWDYPSFKRALEKAYALSSVSPVTVNIHMWDEYELDNPGGLTGLYRIGSPCVSILDGRRRFTSWYNEQRIISNFKDYVTETEANYPVASAIGFNSSLKGRELDLDLKLYIKQSGDYKVSVFILEGGVIGQQYDTDLGIIEQYRHDDFARLALTDYEGDAFKASARSIKKLHYSIAIPEEYDKDRLSVAVIVQRAFGSQRKIVDEGYDYGDYYVDNCVSARTGVVVLPALVSAAGGNGNEDVTNGEPVNW